MHQSVKGLLYAGVTASLWGVLAIVLKIALNYFDPYTVVWWRFAMAFSVLFLFYAIKRPSYLLILKRPPWKLLLAGLLLGTNYIGFMQGVNHAGPSVTQVLIQVGPLTLASVGFIFFHERITRLQALGFVLAIIGFSFFYYQQLIQMFGNADALNAGVLWTLLAALAWAGFAVINKVLVKRIPSSQINLVLYGVPALLFIPLADFHSILAAFSSPLLIFLLLFAGGNTLVAYGSLALALKYAEANKISIIITLNPIITFVLLEILLWMNVEWLDTQSVGLVSYLGALVVLVGAVLALGSKKRRG